MNLYQGYSFKTLRHTHWAHTLACHETPFHWLPVHKSINRALKVCVCLWSTFPPHSLVCSRWLMVAGFQSVPSFLCLPLHREEEKKSSCASGNDRLSHTQQCRRPWYASAALWSMPQACSRWEPGCTMDKKVFIPMKTDFTFEDRDGE